MTAEDRDGEPPAGPEPAPETAPESAMESVAEAGRRAGRPRIEVRGKSYREIAVDPCPGPRAGVGGAGPVKAEWHLDGSMRARVRLLLRRARAAAKHGPRGG